MRTYAVTILLFIMMLLSEVHKFWEGDNRIVNWIWLKPVPMSMQWNFKQATDLLWPISLALCILLYKKNRMNHITVITFLVWFILDSAMYFINYKSSGYWKLYYFIWPVWITLYLWSKHTKKIQPSL